MTTFVVIGGNAAGMSAASVAKRRDPSLDVVVLEEGPFVSYSACGIPYWVSGAVEGGPDRLVSVTPEEARGERGIDLRLGWSARAVDARRRVVGAVDADGRGHELPYDELCLATGSEPVMPFAAEPARGLFLVRHLPDGQRMRSFLAEQSPQRAVIVGGGYVALEMAEAFVERGLETTMVLRRRRLLGETLDEDMAAPLLAQVEARGVETVVALTEGVVASGGRVRAVRTQGGDVPADLVVVATGVRPRSALARAMGCDLVEPGAIAVDARMRTSVPHVWAAGDCATSWHRLLERPVYAPLALAANRGGRIVGENVAGGDERAPGVLGTVITRFFGTDVARTGLTEVEAEAAGHRAVATTITDSVASGYMPGAGEARFKLVAQRGSGRLFGAQIVGSRGAGKRIDTVVAALHLGATAGALADMDLAYAPPYSPVYDPLLIAARLAQRSARE